MNSLSEIQRCLLKEAEVISCKPPVTEELQVYRERYLLSREIPVVPSSRKELLNDIHKGCDVVLFGDFHTLIDSQTGFCDLVKNYHFSNPLRRISIGLESLTCDQEHFLKLYLQNKITDTQFLDMTENHWPYPWENFGIIFNLARKHGWDVFGIDSFGSLDERDRIAGKTINKHANPGELVFVLIGEFHLAASHLPRYLEEKKYLNVFLNCEKHFETAINFDTDTLVRDSNYYIYNTSPWFKWYSYLEWEEQALFDQVCPKERFEILCEKILSLLKVKAPDTTKLKILAAEQHCPQILRDKLICEISTIQFSDINLKTLIRAIGEWCYLAKGGELEWHKKLAGNLLLKTIDPFYRHSFSIETVCIKDQKKLFSITDPLGEQHIIEELDDKYFGLASSHIAAMYYLRDDVGVAKLQKLLDGEGI